MTWFLFVLLFLGSCFMLAWLSSHLVKSLVSIAKYLHWREFIIAFFVMAFAACLPDLFVDLNAIFHGIPELAFGDIIGGNLVDLTLVMAIAIFFSKNPISTKSDMVQKSALFTSVIALLPLVLVLDNRLDRIDGLILILAFGVYSWWIFSKKERFAKTYKDKKIQPIKGFKNFLFNLGKIVVLLGLLLLSSQVVVSSAMFFSEKLGISLGLVGILIVGLGNCFPETYFSIISARKEENWLVLGDLMGSVIIAATLVLGLIGVLYPFEIKDFSPFFVARVFLIVGSIFAYIFIRSGKEVTKKEGVLLLAVYIFFLMTEIFTHQYF